MSIDNIDIFQKYLEVLEEAFPRKKGEKSQISGGTRKYGLLAGVSAPTSTKPESSPEEETRRSDVVRSNYIKDAMEAGRFIDLKEIEKEAPLEKKKNVKSFFSEIPDSNIFDVVYWFDYPKIVNDLVVMRNVGLDTDSAKSGADYLKTMVIKKLRNDPHWKTELEKAGFTGMKFYDNKSIEDFANKKKNWWFSIPMREIEGGDVRQQRSFIKPRTGGTEHGSEANIMPKSPTKSELKYLKKEFGSEGVDAPIGQGETPEGDTTPLNLYEPKTKGIQNILAKPEEKKKTSKPKRKPKITKESYEPFIKIIPF